MPNGGVEPVVIVGGGPVGLVCALSLVRRGVPVLVLEAELEPIQDPRGAAFHPPTIEMLDRLGVMPILAPMGVVVPVWQVRTRAGEVIAEFDLGLLKDATRFPYRFHLGQQKVVPVLLAQLAAEPLAEVRPGARVTGLTQDAAGVTLQVEAPEGATSTVRAPWVIGADGAHSIVRKAAGIDFEGFTWPERFVVTNLADDLGRFGFALTNYVADPDRWAVVLRLQDEDGGPNWRITYPTDTDSEDGIVLDPDEVQRRLVDVVPAAERFQVRYAGIYRVHQRVAATFRRDRIMLVGDAAHINNPLGGFGLNSGIHDAVNLAEKLAAVWHAPGNASTAPLDIFEQQRRRINVKYIQSASIRNKRTLAERNPEVRERTHAELRKIAETPELAREYLMESSMIKSISDEESTS